VTSPDVPPILCDVPGSFPWLVFHDRHPKVVAQVKAGHAYPAGHQRALDDLVAETLTGTVRPLPASAPDHADWQRWGAEYVGRPWTDLPFLWAESYFQRRLLEALCYFDPGPWFGLDPFQVLKSAELTDPGLPGELAGVDAVALRELVVAAVWGNRADLGFRLGLTAAGGGPAEDGLVADDSPAVVAALGAGAGRRIALITDNAGRELLADLILIDHLVRTGLAGEVVVHLKPHPTLSRTPPPPTSSPACGGWRKRTARRRGPGTACATAVTDGRVRLFTHPFYTAPFGFHEMPPDLAGELAAGSLTVLKGDLNYRRLVGDGTGRPPPRSPTPPVFPGPGRRAAHPQVRCGRRARRGDCVLFGRLGRVLAGRRPARPDPGPAVSHQPWRRDSQAAARSK
jgi:hypothetical protein